MPGTKDLQGDCQYGICCRGCMPVQSGGTASQSPGQLRQGRLTKSAAARDSTAEVCRGLPELWNCQEREGLHTSSGLLAVRARLWFGFDAASLCPGAHVAVSVFFIKALLLGHRQEDNHLKLWDPYTCWACSNPAIGSISRLDMTNPASLRPAMMLLPGASSRGVGPAPLRATSAAWTRPSVQLKLAGHAEWG